MQARIPADTVALSWVLGKDGAWLFVVPPAPGKIRVHRLDGNAARWARDARRLAALMSQHTESEGIRARLGQQMFGPAAAALKKARKVWLIPDSSLWYTPLEALPVPGEPAPLGVTHAVERLPALGLMASPAALQTTLSAAIFAAPALDPSLDLSDLPGAEKEARAILPALGEGGILYSGAAADALFSLPRSAPAASGGARA